MEKPSGMCVVVFGDIPPGAGLSSSSALVCAAALATAYANKVSYSIILYHLFILKLQTFLNLYKSQLNKCSSSKEHFYVFKMCFEESTYPQPLNMLKTTLKIFLKVQKDIFTVHVLSSNPCITTHICCGQVPF